MNLNVDTWQPYPFLTVQCPNTSLCDLCYQTVTSAAFLVLLVLFMVYSVYHRHLYMSMVYTIALGQWWPLPSAGCCRYASGHFSGVRQSTHQGHPEAGVQPLCGASGLCPTVRDSFSVFSGKLKGQLRASGFPQCLSQRSVEAEHTHSETRGQFEEKCKHNLKL